MTGGPASPGEGGLTRRTVLGGMAAAGAACLISPSVGLASALGGEAVFSRWVGSFSGVSDPLFVARGFALVGVQWTRAAGARIELRTRAGGGAWSRWAVASVLGHEPDRTHGHGDELRSAPGDDSERGVFGEPIWTGPADVVQLRTSQRLHRVRLHFVGRPVSSAAIASTALPLAAPVLPAGPGQPPIIARVAWARGHAPPAVSPGYGTIDLAFVHHTESPNGYSAADVPAILLSIFDYHRFVRGYHDIAYNFMIDAFGRIWEARAGGIDEPVVGAHAGGYNTVSTGVAVVGSFMDVAPSRAAIQALEELLAWKLSLHGVPVKGRVTVEVNPADAFYTPFAPGAHVSLPRVAGHRDGDSTDCPGNVFYARLPSIRPRVAALAGRPAKITLSTPKAAVIAGASVLASGRLALLGGPPIPGAPIDLQQVKPSGAITVASATTAADGTWSASILPTKNVLLRALHALSPAAASSPVEIAVAPAITLALDSLSPLRVSGAISPVKRRVTIDLDAVHNGRRRRVASRRVTVSRGQFAAKLPTQAPGRYAMVARTAADGSNLAGSSPVLRITL